MNIILLRDIEKLGDKHTIVTVKSGYGRNYLIPQGAAVIANSVNKKKLESLIAEEEAKEAAKLEDYRQIANQLNGKLVKVGVKAGTSGKIFGSINALQISQAIKDQIGIDIDRKKIAIAEDIKELGTYKAQINLHKEVNSSIDFELVTD
jgi:large subunit ribosomal protein L9